MCDQKCTELAPKLQTLHDLLSECCIQGLPDHLEAAHQTLVREFERLRTEWQAHQCDRAGLNLTRIDA